MKRIVISDDHDFIVYAIKAVLSKVAAYEVVGSASSPEELMIAMEELRPDILLLDISYRGTDVTGIDLLKMIKPLYPETLVIVISQHEQECTVRDAFQAGASGYVLKTDSTNEIKPALKAVLSGQTYYSSSLALKMANLQVSGTGFDQIFSDTDLQYIRYFAQLKTPEDIAQIMGVTPRTVRNIRTRIKGQLNVTTDFEFLNECSKAGLITLKQD